MSGDIYPSTIIHPLDFRGLISKLHSASDAQRTYPINSHITCLAISNDEKYVLGTKECVLVYNPLTLSGKEVLNSRNAQSLTLTKDNSYILAAIEKTIQAWHYEDLTEAFSLAGHSNDVTAVKITYDNRYAISSSKDRTLKVWDIRTRENAATLNAEGWVWCMVLSKDGKNVFAGSRDIRVWDLDTYALKITLPGNYAASPRCLEISDDGNLLYVGLRDKTIRVWNVPECKEIFSLKGHEGEVTSIALDEEDAILISASTDNTIAIWDLHENEKEGALTAHTNTVTSIVLSPDKSYFLSASTDSMLKKWSFRTNRREKTIMQHGAWVLNVALTPDYKYIISSSEKFIKFWNQETDSADGVLEHKDQVISLKLSNNGEYVASGCKDKLVYVWNLNFRKLEFTLEGHKDEVFCVSWSPDDMYVLSGAGSLIRVWNLATKELDKELVGHAATVYCIKVTPDLIYIISSSADKSIKIWSYIDGSIINTMNGHTDQIFSIEYINNLNTAEPLIVSASFDKTIRIWSLNDKRCLDVLEGHKEGIRNMIVTDDGSYIITASIDKTIKIWDLHDKRLFLTLEGHDNWVLSLAAGPDLSYLVSCSADKSIKVWQLNGLFFNLCQYDSMKKDEISIFYKGNLEFRKNLFSIDVFNEGRYQQWMGDIVLGPLRVNAVHICCYFSLFKSLKQALNFDCPIFQSINGESPFKVPLEKNSRKCADILLEYLIKLNELNDPRLPRYIEVITSDIPSILKTGSSYLPDFLEILFSEVKEKCLPSYAVPKSALPIQIQSPAFYMVAENFVNTSTQQQSGQEQLLRYVRSLFKWRFENGSYSSLEILKAIRDSPTSEIYRTSIIGTIIRRKWDSLWTAVVLFTLLYWAVLICLTIIVFQSDDSIGIQVIFLILNIFFFGYEAVQFVAQGKTYLTEYWNYLDLMRTCVCIVWVLMNMRDRQETLLTWFVVITCFIRGLTYFRAFAKTRFYVRMIIDTAKKTVAFLVVLLYSTLAFCVLYSASDDNEESFEDAWHESFELDMGGFDTSTYSDLKKACFHLASIINCILMLNLLIAILGDAFESFLQKANEADLTEMLDLIIELEYLMIWKRNTGIEVYLQKCDTNVDNADEDEWEGRTKALERKLDTWGNDIHSKIETFQEALENFEDRINRNHEKKINEMGKALESKISELYEMLKNIQPQVEGRSSDFEVRLR